MGQSTDRRRPVDFRSTAKAVSEQGNIGHASDCRHIIRTAFPVSSQKKRWIPLFLHTNTKPLGCHPENKTKHLDTPSGCIQMLHFAPLTKTTRVSRVFGQSACFQHLRTDCHSISPSELPNTYGCHSTSPSELPYSISPCTTKNRSSGSKGPIPSFLAVFTMNSTISSWSMLM